MPDPNRPEGQAASRPALRLAAVGEPRPRRRVAVLRVSGEELVLALALALPAVAVGGALASDPSVLGALRAAVLWAAVWLGWQGAARLTAEFDPSSRPVRDTLFGLALAGLATGAALPGAFGRLGLAFSIGVVALRLGAAARAARPPADTAPAAGIVGGAVPAGTRRAGGRGLALLGAEAALWLAGGLLGPGGIVSGAGAARLLCWIAAGAAGAAFERTALRGFPGAAGAAGAPADPVAAAECGRLFYLVVLGLGAIAVGRDLGAGVALAAPSLAALFAAGGLLAAWQLRLAGADDAERLAPRRAAVPAGAVWLAHALMVAGLVAIGVADGLAIAAPMATMVPRSVALMFAGPLLLVAGTGWWRRLAGGRTPVSHVFALVALLMLLPASFAGLRITVLLLGNAILLGLCVWEHLERRGGGAARR